MKRSAMLSLLLCGSACAAGLVTPEVASKLGMTDEHVSVAESLLLGASQRLNADASAAAVAALDPTVRAAPHVMDPAGLNITRLDVGEGGSRCMDGSPYAYYFRAAPANSTHKNNWVFFMQGGGLCITLIDCQIRAKGGLGSSKGYGPTYTDNDNVLSSDPSVNPFWDFNHVWLPYCSGDVHTGTQTKRNGYGLYFSGSLNFEATVNRLRTLGLDSASQVILSGSSAGGIGTNNNVDLLQEWLPRAKVYGMPAGGHFFPQRVELSETQLLRKLHILTSPVYINDLFTMVVTQLYNSRLPPVCANKTNPEDAYRCWDASYNYDYIAVPLLTVENQMDKLMIQDILLCFDCPKWDKQYIGYFGEKMRESLSRKPLYSTRRNAVWAPSCFVHTNNLCLSSSPVIDGQHLRSVAQKWFFNDEDVSLIDPCSTSAKSQPCQSHCSDFRCRTM